MTAPDPRVGEIEARLSAATPGPWMIGKDRMDRVILAGPYSAFLVAKVGDLRNPLLAKEAQFIANAPADVAYLLAELRKAHEALARVEDLAKDWDATYEVFPRSVAGILAKAHGDQIRAAVAAANGDGL